MAVTVVSFLSVIFGLVAVISTFTYYYVKFTSYDYWRKRKVVFEEPSFPFGNLAAVVFGKINPGELYWRLYEKYKKHRYFGTYALQKPVLVINDPELIKLVLTKEFTHFHDRNFFNNDDIDPLAGHLFALSGAKWRNLRFKLTPTFTSGKMKIMFETVNTIGNKLKTCFAQSLEQDVKVNDILGRFTTEVISATAFGIKTDSLTNPNCAFRVHGKKVFEPRPVMNALFTFAPKILELLRMPYFDRQVRKFFISVFEEAIDVRLKEKVVSKPRDFLDLLVQLVQNGYVVDDEGNTTQSGDKEHTADEKLTVRQTLAQAFVFFLAGFETSSLAATYALFELARTPDAQEKLRSEIFRVLEKHNGLTYESLSDMPYLTKVVNETLRIYPSVMVLNRLCTETIDLPTTDLRIEKGMDIIIPITGLQSDPDIWPNPEKFDPERFSPENIASRHSYTYLPFGEGPRVCIGMRFGVMSVKVAIISALTSCRFEVSQKTILPIIIDPGSLIVYDSKNPIYLKLCPLETKQ